MTNLTERSFVNNTKILIFTQCTGGNGDSIEKQAEKALANLEGNWEVCSTNTAVAHFPAWEEPGRYKSEYVLTVVLKKVP